MGQLGSNSGDCLVQGPKMCIFNEHVGHSCELADLSNPGLNKKIKVAIVEPRLLKVYMKKSFK